MREKLKHFLETDLEVFDGQPLFGTGETADDGMLETCMDAINAFKEGELERYVPMIRGEGENRKFYGKLPAKFVMVYAKLYKFLEAIENEAV